MRYLTLFLCLFLASCKDDNTKQLKLRVGVTAGPHAIIMNHIKELAANDGLDIDVIEFNDFIQPNAALANKEIDANCYQHEPFLTEQVKTRCYPIQCVAKTVLMPMGVYSKAFHSLPDLPKEARIAIPNDPTNGGRALQLLQAAGIILLEDVPCPGIHHVKENINKINIIEIDAPQLPRSLEDVDAAIINTDWVMLSGMNTKMAIKVEDKSSPYTNIIAIHNDSIGDERIKKFISIYQSPENEAFIKKQFKGSILTGW